MPQKGFPLPPLVLFFFQKLNGLFFLQSFYSAFAGFYFSCRGKLGKREDRHCRRLDLKRGTIGGMCENAHTYLTS